MQVITLIGENGRPVCERCEVADGPLERLRGLLGRDALPDDAALLLRPCSSIHTSFLRFPIDAVFLDRDFRVLDVVSKLRPWRAAWRRGAHAVLELPAGAAACRGVARGARLAWGAPARAAPA